MRSAQRKSTGRCLVLAAVLAGLVACAWALAADWPQFRADALHSGKGDAPISDSPQVAWRVRLGGSVDGSPIVVGGRVYVGTNEGRMCAVDAATGRLLWTFEAAGAIAMAAGAWSGRIVFGDAAGFFYCLSADTGKQLWRLHTRDSIVASPLMLGEACYWGGMDGLMRAVRVADGTVLWQRRLNGPISASAVSDGRAVYIADESGVIWALDARSGHVIWSTKTDAWGMSPLVLAGGVLIAPLVCPTRLAPPRVNYLVALRPADGDVLWTVRHARSIFAAPILVGERVAYISVEGYLSATVLRVVNSADGREVLKRPLGGVVDSSPAWAGQRMYFGCHDGHLYAVNLADFSVIARVPLAPKIFSSPALSGGRLFIGASDGCLYCLK